MANRTKASSQLFTTQRHQQICAHTDPEHQHPDITSLNFTFSTTSNTPNTRSRPHLGLVQTILLHKPFLSSATPNPTTLPTTTTSLWAQCHAYDTAHAPSSKMHKVENYLGNECFHPAKQALLDQAKWVLYVEKVVLYPAYKGRGLGLRIVDAVIHETCAEMEGKGEGVVLLEPGPVVLGGGGSNWGEGQSERYEGFVGKGEVEREDDATERIRRHWMRMGFEAWSYTDEAWLCLSTRERPMIDEDVREVVKGKIGQNAGET